MTKSELRKLFIAKRKSFHQDQIKIQSEKIASLFFSNIELRGIKTIHSFLPIMHNNEVNTSFITDELKAKHPYIQLIIPKVIRGNSLENYIWTHATKLHPNSWGIPEPVGGEQIASAEIDLVLIPLLAFDRQGHRVGYGKGFYDRFLSMCRPDAIKVGLSIEESIDFISDVDTWDIKLTHCVTPTTFWTFN